MTKTKGVGGGWMQRSDNPVLTALMGPDTWYYRKEVADGVLNVMVTPDQGEGFHLSISHQIDGKPGRYPSWDEILEARDRFTPGHVEMVMYLPTKEAYVNAHETTFHLWSLPKEKQ